jgi:thioredoxin-like negative regulator of GroEL
MLPARSLARLAPLVPPVRPGRAAWAGGRRFSAATAKSKFIVEVNGRDEFDRVVVQSKVPVVLDAYADWCGRTCARRSLLAERLARAPS